jgi:hypothetical protein
MQVFLKIFFGFPKTGVFTVLSVRIPAVYMHLLQKLSKKVTD